MSAITRYADYSLLFGTTSVPFEPNSLEAGSDPRLDDIRSASSPNVQLRQVIGKRPFIKGTLLDPTAIANPPVWTPFGSGKTITLVEGIWRQFDADGTFNSTYVSRKLASGILIPLSLTGSVDKKVGLDFVAYGIFTTGTGFTAGTDSGALATVTKAFYPTSLTLGATPFTALKSISVNWQYSLQDDEQLEPGYYYYDAFTLKGSAVLKDITAATAARLEDGTTESVTALFTDANSATTVSVSFGNCHIFGRMKGDECTIEFEDIA